VGGVSRISEYFIGVEEKSGEEGGLKDGRFEDEVMGIEERGTAYP